MRGFKEFINSVIHAGLAPKMEKIEYGLQDEEAIRLRRCYVNSFFLAKNSNSLP